MATISNRRTQLLTATTQRQHFVLVLHVRGSIYHIHSSAAKRCKSTIYWNPINAVNIRAKNIDNKVGTLNDKESNLKTAPGRPWLVYGVHTIL